MNASINPALGWDPDGNRLEVKLTNRSGATTGKGEVVMLDIGGTAAEVTALAGPGGSDSPWANYVDTAETDNNVAIAGIFAIALEEIVNDATGLCLLRGLSTYTAVDGSTIIGSALVPQADGELLLAATTGYKVVALALEADTANVATVLFDGINGLGTDD